jgi:hypothetical protein
MYVVTSNYAYFGRQRHYGDGDDNNDDDDNNNNNIFC